MSPTRDLDPFPKARAGASAADGAAKSSTANGQDGARREIAELSDKLRTYPARRMNLANGLRATVVILTATLSCAAGSGWLAQPGFAAEPAGASNAGAAGGGAPAAAAAQTLSAEELDQLVAPIALYPDDLLATVLMASTYPLEIVQADRWARSNKSLKGAALKAALAKQPWDDTVKALVVTPQVLATISEQLDWTQKLGDAVLAQQADVMDAVQRLRLKAQQAGYLKSTKEQTVSVASAPASQAPQTGGGGSAAATQVVVIQSAQPGVVSVPYYDPVVVYGAWPYASYPPYYWPPPAGYYGYYPGWVPGRALAAGVSFGLGLAWANAITGGFNWGRGDINIGQININSGNTVNAAKFQQWQHNPVHRGGVRYSNTEVTAKFSKTNAIEVGNRAEFRGRINNGAGAGGNLQGTAGAEAIKSQLGSGGAGNPKGKPATGEIKAQRGSANLKVQGGSAGVKAQGGSVDLKAKAGTADVKVQGGSAKLKAQGGSSNLKVKAGGEGAGAFSGAKQGGAAAKAYSDRGQASMKSAGGGGAKPAVQKGGGGRSGRGKGELLRR
jgi:hypothetical protein